MEPIVVDSALSLSPAWSIRDMPEEQGRTMSTHYRTIGTEQMT